MLEVLGASRVRLLEEPLAGLASLLSRLGSGGDLFLGETIELCLIFDEYCGSLRASVHLIDEASLEDGDLGVEVLEFLLILGGEQGALMDEILIEELR